MTNVTDVSIYSNDSTQTSVSVTIDDQTIVYGGTWAGSIYTGPEAGAIAIDGLTLSHIVQSTSEHSVMVKNSLISDSTSTGTTQDAVLYMNETSVISGSTFSNNKQNGSNATPRGILLFKGDTGTLYVDNSLFDHNYSSNYATIHKTAATPVKSVAAIYVTGSTFFKNCAKGTGGAAISSQSKGWIYVSGTTNKPVLFIGNTAAYGGAIAGAGHAGQFDIKGSTFYGNTATANGGAIWSQKQIVIGAAEDGCRTVFRENICTTAGGAIYLEYDSVGTTVLSGLTVTDAIFCSNTANYGGAVRVGCEATFTGATFFGNTATSGGGAIMVNATTVTTLVTINNSTFSCNISSQGGAILNQGVLTITDSKFFTETDNISNVGTLTFTGTNNLNASITGGAGSTMNATNSTLVFGNTAAIDIAGLTFSGTNAMTFNGTAAVNFTKSGRQDLSDVAITVNGSRFVDTPITVATGVTTIGADNWTITDGTNDHLALKVDSGNLVLYVKADVEDGECIPTFSGGTSNLMTGGTVTGAFFGMENPASGVDIKTVISGGTVGNAVIGGAKVTKGNTAALGTVTLNIAGGEIIGGTANKGMLYTAGYAYGLTGGTTTDTNPTLTVGRSALNLSGGSIAAQNLYSGAHARAGAYTVVDETVITVTDGTFGRIYGGGWAEKYGVSEVGSSSITVSGGYVEFIYAGGANAANGKTYVNGNVDIQFTGGTVDFVFLAGKNKDCWVGTEGGNNTATLTVSGDAKNMTRISGWNANGSSDRMLGTSVLNLETDLTVGYLDNVDEININEGNLLTVTTMFHKESLADLKVNFVLGGALEESWDVIAGEEIYNCLNEVSTFRIDGTEYTRAANGALGESGYYLLGDAKNRKFVFSSSALAQG